MHGRVPDWVAEIRKLRDAGDTTLFVAATPRARRADHRAAQGIRRLRRAGRARRRCAVRRGAGGDRPAVARLPAARRRPADLRRSRRLRRGPAGAGAPPRRDQGVPVRPARPEDRRSGRPRRPRHRRLRRAEADRRRRQRRRSSSSCATPATTSCSSRSSGSTWSRSTPARTRPPVDRLGGTSWERAKTQVKKAMRDMAEELLKLYAARKAVPGHAFSADSHWQQEFEDAFEYDADAGSEDGDRRHQARHGVADADGSPAVRRRRLRQDRGGDARRVQGGDGRQAGGVSGADDRARVSAREDPEGALRRLSGAHRHGQPVPQQGGAEGGARPISPPARSTSSSARIGCCRRTCSSAISACWSWTRSSGSASATRRGSSRCGKKVDVLTMSATPIPRTLNMSLVGIRDMSIIETPPKDRLSIQTNVVKFDQQVISRAIRNELERGGQVYLRPQPRRVDLLDRQSDPAAGARGAGRGRPRPDGRGRARAGDARLRGAASSTCCWRRPSSRTASTSRTPTRSSSTAPTATACRSSISCAAGSADRIGRPTPIC